MAPQWARIDEEFLPVDTTLIRDSFDAVVPRGDKFAETFYGLLFERYPLAERMFADTSMAAQQKKIVLALSVLVRNLEHPDALAALLDKLGKGHREYGVYTPNHYRAFGECLLAALAKTLGGLWTPRLEEAWTEAFTIASTLMQRGANAAEPVAPVSYAETATIAPAANMVR